MASPHSLAALGRRFAKRCDTGLLAALTAHPEIDDVVVGSKWDYRYVGDWRMDAGTHEVKDHSLAAFTAQWAQTSALLGERVGIYHVHSATLHSGVLDDAAVHRALAGLPECGVRVGVSTSGPRQADAVRRALAVTVDGGRAGDRGSARAAAGLARAVRCGGPRAGGEQRRGRRSRTARDRRRGARGPRRGPGDLLGCPLRPPLDLIERGDSRRRTCRLAGTSERYSSAVEKCGGQR